MFCVLIKIAFVQERRLEYGLLENVVRCRFVFVLLLEVPSGLRVKFFELLVRIVFKKLGDVSKN